MRRRRWDGSRGSFLPPGIPGGIIGDAGIGAGDNSGMGNGIGNVLDGSGMDPESRRG